MVTEPPLSDPMPSAGPSTRSVHLTEAADPHTGAVVPPTTTSSAFAYPDIPTWRAVALGEASGHIYARNSNPTTDRFEAKVAALEHAERGTSFGTGMAAITTTLLALLAPGRRMVTVQDTYGATNLLSTRLLPGWGVECDVRETDDHEALVAAIREGCDVVYLETPTNPTCKVLDISGLADAAHEVGAVVVVDNTFASPINTRPLDHGADLVLHSASKYLGGHGDVLGGVVVGAADLVEKVYALREIIGTGMDPTVAGRMLRSLKTLGLRVQRQNANAQAVAEFLQGRPEVEDVLYPGLPSHPGHAVAVRQMDGFGGVLSFSLAGGMPAVETVCAALGHAYLAANLGQVETIAGPPATTSHVELSAEERAAAGIPEGLIRYAVGIEDAADLIADLAQALDRL